MSQAPTSELTGASGFRRGLAAVNELQRRGQSWSGYERNCCYLNTGALRFANVSATSGFDFLDDARGVAVVDWNQDGNLDLWVTNRTGPRVRCLLNSRAEENYEWVAVRLRGTTCNRDAIGARVEVTPDAGEGEQGRIRTLRAGAGYLSQSSKILHFGLGRASTDLQLTVHWPGGKVERFRGLRPRRQHLVVQGSGRAKVLPTSGVSSLGVSSSDNSAGPTSQGPTAQRARSFLPLSIPLPALPFDDWEENRQSVAEPGSVVLLNLWSASCRPCLEELREWATNKQPWHSAGVKLVALNVDSLGEVGKPANRDQSASQMKSLLTKLQFPGRTGRALPETIKKLELLQLHLFDSQRPLPVPSSFLIDAHGALMAWYRGPVDADQVLADAAALNQDRSTHLDRSTPFPGTWRARPDRTNVSAVVRVFKAAGLTKDAIPILQTAIRSRPDDVDLLKQLASEWMNLQRGNDARQALTRAARIDDSDGEVLVQMGVSFLKENKNSDALDWFERAIRIDANNADAHFHFGRLQLAENRTELAAKHLARASQIRPRHVETLINLGLAEQMSGRAASAVSRYESALRADSDNAFAKNNLAWILATTDNNQIRDRKRAFDLAREACEATAYKDPNCLDTLAAVCAAQGNWKAAIDWQQKSMNLSGPTVKKRMQEKLEQYRRSYKSAQQHIDN